MRELEKILHQAECPDDMIPSMLLEAQKDPSKADEYIAFAARLEAKEQVKRSAREVREEPGMGGEMNPQMLAQLMAMVEQMPPSQRATLLAQMGLS